MAIVKRMKKDGTPSYQVVVSRRDTVTGKRKQSIIGTYRIKKDAQKAERKALDDIEKSAFVDRNADTVTELFTAWSQHMKGQVTAKTMSDYQIMIDLHILPYLGHARVQSLQSIDIQVWIDALDVGDRTRHRTLMVLKQAYGFAINMKIVAASPCAVVKVKKPTPTPPILWTDEQYWRFREVADEDTYATLWHILCVTGVRIGEGAGFGRIDINRTSPSLSVRQVVVPEFKGSPKPTIKDSPKTEAGRRIITVSPETIEFLDEHDSGFDLITCYDDGEPLSYSGIRRKLKTLCKNANVPYLRPHGFRYLHATHLARAGVPIKVAMDRLGHTSPNELLRIYQLVEQEMRTDVVTKLDAMLNANRNANGDIDKDVA